MDFISTITAKKLTLIFKQPLRVARRYPFKVAPDFARHSDIFHMVKLVDRYIAESFDYIFCLVDMDRLLRVPKEMKVYIQAKKKYEKSRKAKVRFIETNPCTEFWFLLHFIPSVTSRHYSSYEELLPDLRRYLPDYEKTKRYFSRINIFMFLAKNGDLNRAMANSDTLRRLSIENPDDYKSYSEIHEVLKTLDDWAQEK